MDLEAAGPANEESPAPTVYAEEQAPLGENERSIQSGKYKWCRLYDINRICDSGMGTSLKHTNTAIVPIQDKTLYNKDQKINGLMKQLSSYTSVHGVINGLLCILSNVMFRVMTIMIS